MTSTLPSLPASVEDPAFHLGDPYPTYAWLRRHDPVHRRDDGLWLVTRYDDIETILKDSKGVTSKQGVFLGDALGIGGGIAGYFGDSEALAMLDPPRQAELRQVIAPAFIPRRVASLGDSIRATARDLVAALPVDEPVDLASTAAKVLPLVVIARLLGLEGVDIDQMVRWIEEMEKLGLTLTPEERAESIAVFSGLNEYMSGQLEAKRICPAEDVMSTLVEARVKGQPLAQETMLMLASNVFAGAAETTRNLIDNMVRCLADHPDQLRLLVAGSITPEAVVEETLRWCGPLNYICRQLAADVTIGGRELPAGDWVCLLFASGNRDEAVFVDPERFDASLPRADSLAFGRGPHYCPGQALARLEAQVLLEELIARFPFWELIGEPHRVVSEFHNGIIDLPLRFFESPR
jgi:cytochrome P450